MKEIEVAKPARHRVLACVPGAIPADERPAHFALIAELFASAQGPIPIAGGYAFRFPASQFESLTRFVANERRCCPFLDFTLEIPAEEQSICLRLTGPDGTREFLDMELPIGRE